MIYAPEPENKVDLSGESVDTLNNRMRDYYGIVSTGQANWRLVWSNDQFEDRFGEYEDKTPEGIFIRRVKEWRRVPKYRQWIRDKWVLEALVEVPHGTIELATKLTYEPMYAFPHIDRQPRVPIWDAIKLLIDSVNAKVGISHRPRYQDPEANPEEAAEEREARLKRIEEDLYGNDNDVTDALRYREGVGFTTSKIKGSETVERTPPRVERLRKDVH